MSEGILKKQILEIVAEISDNNTRNNKYFEKILDKAKKDLTASACNHCYWSNEGSCEGKPDGHIYVNQPDDCPLRLLEKWFGEAQP